MIKEICPRTLTALLFAAAAASACSWGTGGSGTNPTPMHRRFLRTMDIQTGVVLGDLDRAHAAAAGIATDDEGGDFPAGFESYRTEIREYAALIAEDPQLPSVAMRTGRMAAACGSCHIASGGGPRFVIGSEPGDGASTGKRMIRHIWATDRMWEGLAGPSDDMWIAGSRVLAEGEEALEGAIRASSSPEAARGFLAEIGRLGREGQTATTQEARASVYGRLLATCYGCHRTTGVVGVP